MPTRSSALQRELKQTRPFRTAGQEATLGLLRTTDYMRRRLTAAMAPEDLTPQQYNVLRILRGAGQEGLPTLEIAERMIEQTPGITRLIDRLETKQLVTRERCPTDRRQVTCRISRPGLAMLDRLESVLVAAEESMLGRLTAAELRQLVRLLDRIRATESG